MKNKEDSKWEQRDIYSAFYDPVCPLCGGPVDIFDNCLKGDRCNKYEPDELSDQS